MVARIVQMLYDIKTVTDAGEFDPKESALHRSPQLIKCVN